jgi:single-strand DNA-binding protein
MPNHNKAQLMGNLTRDPELRYTPQGSAVCEFAIAINRKWKNKQTGQMQEEVDFFDIVAWGKTAEICAEYLKKGRPVFIEGHLKQDRWESPEGKKMSKVKVIVENVQFLGAKPGPAEQQQPQEAPAAAGEQDQDVPF